MVPFTNQFKSSYEFKGADKDLVFHLSSCVHEGIKANFKDDYMAGVNFYCGLNRSLADSDLFTPNRFGSFSQIRQNCWSKLYNDGEFYF